MEPNRTNRDEESHDERSTDTESTDDCSEPPATDRRPLGAVMADAAERAGLFDDGGDA
jgi:hypothetical protein